MGKAKKTRKFAEVKRMLNPKDLKSAKPPPKKKAEQEAEVRHVDKTPAALFFRYNTQLGPPYQVRHSAALRARGSAPGAH